MINKVPGYGKQMAENPKQKPDGVFRHPALAICIVVIET
jgi:hypothetical protein